MRIFRIGISKTLDRQAMAEAVAALKRGGAVVYPTETAYALGCDATNRAALKKIYAIKSREKGKALPWIVGSAAMARRCGRFDAMSAALARAFWPGPLTLVIGGQAMRVSAHPVARGLSRRLGRPVVSTSANLSGGRTRYAVTDILADLGATPDIVLDAGPLPARKPSTIVRCDACCCEILREGPISAAALRRQLSIVNRQP